MGTRVKEWTFSLFLLVARIMRGQRALSPSMTTSMDGDDGLGGNMGYCKDAGHCP